MGRPDAALSAPWVALAPPCPLRGLPWPCPIPSVQSCIAGLAMKRLSGVDFFQDSLVCLMLRRGGFCVLAMTAGLEPAKPGGGSSLHGSCVRSRDTALGRLPAASAGRQLRRRAARTPTCALMCGMLGSPVSPRLSLPGSLCPSVRSRGDPAPDPDVLCDTCMQISERWHVVLRCPLLHQVCPHALPCLWADATPGSGPWA